MRRHVKFLAVVLVILCAIVAENTNSVKCGYDCKNLTRANRLYSIAYKSLRTK